ncbi:hypothetical protein ACKWTF_013446 [Chironomus riparius]
MKSLALTFFALIVDFESGYSQYNWNNPYNFEFRQDPNAQHTFNRNYQPNNYFTQQQSNSFYPQASNSFIRQPSSSFYTAPAYRYYPQQQGLNSFYSQPSYLTNQQPSNVNYQQPQQSNDNYLQQQSLQYSNQHPNSQDSSQTSLNTAHRVSEMKCEEYLNMSLRNVSSSALSLRPAFQNVKMENCENSISLIINGENAKAGEFPHMAAVGYKDKNRVAHFVCGGSLISDQFVLSAAHCRIFDGKASSIVRLGVLNLKVKEQSSYEIDIAIESFISHENYDPNRKKNDIAVIKLVNKVSLSKFIRPACLMTPDNQVNVDKAVVTGWGLTQAFTGLTSDILQKAKLKIKDISTCRNYLDNENVDSSQICAGDKTRDTCSGDSGGPLQIISPKNKCVNIIVGITSFGSQYCGVENSVAVYTKVAAYLTWIEQKVWGSS